MGNVGFDTTRWDHWLLIASFVVLALIGLRLSWQWRRQRQQAKGRLVRRLSLQRGGHRRSGDDAFGHDELADRKSASLTLAELTSDAARQRSYALSSQRLPRYVRGKRRNSSKRVTSKRVTSKRIR